MSTIKYEIKCETCGVQFTARRAEYQSVPRYCSNACKFEGKRGNGPGRSVNMDYICKICGKHVTGYRGPKYLNRVEPQFCSRQCLGVSQRNENNPNYKKGRRRIKGGYIGIFKPDHPCATDDGLVPEHRLVMEAHIGRLLTETERVHHKDENRSNNVIDNLELCDSQSEHMKLHRTGGRYYE